MLQREDRAYLSGEKEKLYQSCFLALAGEDALLPASFQRRLQGPVREASPPPTLEVIGSGKLKLAQSTTLIGDRLYARMATVLGELQRQSGGRQILSLLRWGDALVEEAAWVQERTASSISPKELNGVLDGAAKHAMGRLKQALEHAEYQGELMNLVGEKRALAVLLEPCPAVGEAAVRTFERKWTGGTGTTSVVKPRGRVAARKVGELAGALAGVPVGAVYFGAGSIGIAWNPPAAMTGASVGLGLAGGALALFVHDPEVLKWAVIFGASPTAFWGAVGAVAGMWRGCHEGAERVGDFLEKLRAPIVEGKLFY